MLVFYEPTIQDGLWRLRKVFSALVQSVTALVRSVGLDYELAGSSWITYAGVDFLLPCRWLSEEVTVLICLLRFSMTVKRSLSAKPGKLWTRWGVARI